MDILHHFKLENNWKGNTGEGTSSVDSYSRTHEIEFSGKPSLMLTTADKERGSNDLLNPEDLLVAAVSSCHMLSYLYLCAKSRVIVTSYKDMANGEMIEHSKGGGHFKKITLMPVVTVTEESMREKAIHLHHKAHEICYIASSVNFEIALEPQIKIEGK